MRELIGFFVFKMVDGGHLGFAAHIGKIKFASYSNMKEHIQIPCLYDKMYTPSWIMHHSAGLERPFTALNPPTHTRCTVLPIMSDTTVNKRLM